MLSDKKFFANAEEVMKIIEETLVRRIDVLEKNWTPFKTQHLELIKDRD